VADKEGRFRVEGLLPSQRYTLFAGEGSLTRREHLTHRHGGWVVEAGKSKDAGELKPKLTRE
jgi:hypothetical protein